MPNRFINGFRLMVYTILVCLTIGFLIPTALGAIYMGTYFGQIGLNLLFTLFR